MRRLREASHTPETTSPKRSAFAQRPQLRILDEAAEYCPDHGAEPPSQHQDIQQRIQRGAWRVRACSKVSSARSAIDAFVVRLCGCFARASHRQVEPQALLVRAPLWYVIGWDRGKDALRLFRMDRIHRARVQDDADFALRSLEVVLGVCPDARRRTR